MTTSAAAVHVQKKQSVYALTAIQVTGATSLPVLNSSIQLLHQYGFATAFWILFVGSFLVWALGFAIVHMTANTTKNTLDNVKDYLGVVGSWSVGLVLLVATIAYYVTQTNLTTETLLALFPFKEGFQIDKFFQFGVVLGVASILAIIQGMKGLRWVTMVSFPIIALAFIGLLFVVPSSDPISLSMPTTIGGLAIALGSSLSVAVDYPTFFQHSKSKRNSLIAVTAIQVITLLIGVGGLYLGEFIGVTKDLSGWTIVLDGTLLMRICFFLLVTLSCICVNTVNVYSASIAWELIAPNFLLGKKEYTILGLALTAIFILTTGIVSVEFLLVLTDTVLANLCLVLAIGYLGKLWVGALSEIEKYLFYAGWMVGSIVIIVASAQATVQPYLLGAGYLISLLTVMLTFLIKRICLRE